MVSSSVRTLFRFFEVGVLEDIGRGADEFEADAVAASVALREAVTGDHDGFMRGAVVAFVQDLVDAGLGDGSTGAKDAAIRAALMLASRATALKFRAESRRPFPCTCGVCIRKGETRHIRVALILILETSTAG